MNLSETSSTAQFSCFDFKDVEVPPLCHLGHKLHIKAFRHISPHSFTALQFFQAENLNNINQQNWWHPSGNLCISALPCDSSSTSLTPQWGSFRVLSCQKRTSTKKKQTTSCWVSKLKWLSMGWDKHRAVQERGSREDRSTVAPAVVTSNRWRLRLKYAMSLRE